MDQYEVDTLIFKFAFSTFLHNPNKLVDYVSIASSFITLVITILKELSSPPHTVYPTEITPPTIKKKNLMSSVRFCGVWEEMLWARTFFFSVFFCYFFSSLSFCSKLISWLFFFIWLGIDYLWCQERKLTLDWHLIWKN